MYTRQTEDFNDGLVVVGSQKVFIDPFEIMCYLVLTIGLKYYDYFTYGVSSEVYRSSQCFNYYQV